MDSDRNRGREQKENPGGLRAAFLKGLTELLVLICAICFFFLVYKIHTIYTFVKSLISILMPIIIGLVLAYLLNPIMVFFEKRLMKGLESHVKTGKRRAEFARIGGIAISFLILFFILYILGALVFPKIRENVISLIAVLPSQVQNLAEWIEAQMTNYQIADDVLEKLSTEAVTYLTNWVKNDMFGQISTVISGVAGVVSTLLNLVVGVVVACYVLMSKETFKRQGKKLLYAFLSDDTAALMIGIIKKSDKIFGGFISGKIVDSLIIGILCFIGALILGLPYAALISVIVGVTNIIPFFGPYIGAVPSAILVLLANPAKGLVFIVFIVLLQQFDGNILGPRILGESTGLSPFWVVFAILVGGGLFGIVGMLVGVPTFGVIYYLFKSYVNYRLEKKEARPDKSGKPPFSAEI